MWEGNPLRPALDAAYGEIAEEFGTRPRGPMNPLGAPLEIKNDEEWLEDEFSGSFELTYVTLLGLARRTGG